MIFKWFDASEAKAFGTLQAQYFMERIPLEAQLNEKKFAAKTKDALEKMNLQVRKFKEDHKLSVYKRAQVGNAFKWLLRDAGYDEAYVEKLTLWLMTQFE